MACSGGKSIRQQRLLEGLAEGGRPEGGLNIRLWGISWRPEGGLNSRLRGTSWRPEGGLNIRLWGIFFCFCLALF